MSVICVESQWNWAFYLCQNQGAFCVDHAEVPPMKTNRCLIGCLVEENPCLAFLTALISPHVRSTAKLIKCPCQHLLWYADLTSKISGIGYQGCTLVQKVVPFKNGTLLPDEYVRCFFKSL